MLFTVDLGSELHHSGGYQNADLELRLAVWLTKYEEAGFAQWSVFDFAGSHPGFAIDTLLPCAFTPRSS